MMAAGQLQPGIDLKGVRRKLVSFTGIGCVPCLCPFLSQPQYSLSALVALPVLLHEDVYQVHLVFLEMTLTAPLWWPQSCSTMWPCSSITCGKRKCCLRGKSSCWLLFLARHFGQLVLSLYQVSSVLYAVHCRMEHRFQGLRKPPHCLGGLASLNPSSQFLYM